MKSLATIAAAFILLTPTHAQLPQPVLIDTGQLRGLPTARPTVTAFLGIPYAAPPVGPLRWRAPQPAAQWPGIRAADHFSRMCPQKPPAENSIYFSGFEESSEDCLYLNLWTPAKSPTERHAVMLWIHGGGFREGSATPRFYDGTNLAAKGVLVVSLNYRVGVFGFFAHPGLTAEAEQSGTHGSGDYGLLDQIAALHWIQRNIAQFGGDPNRVTVFGQSAGGSSASALVASPRAKGLITGAISESGQLICSPDIQLPLSVAEANGKAFAAQLNATTIAELRGKPTAEILAAATTFNLPTRLVIDGYVLPASGADIYASGNENKVPILVGANGNESHTRTTLAKYLDHVRTQFGPHAAEFLALYPAATDAEATLAAQQSTIDEYAFVEWLYAKSHTTHTHAPAFLYTFEHAPPVPAGMYSLQDPGAYHGAEIDYVFNHLDARPYPWTPADIALADTISSYWVNFANTGNPNGPNLPPWPAFDPIHQQQMFFRSTAAAGDVTRQARFKFFEANRTLLYPTP